MNTQRMRIGLFGRLMSADGKAHIAVLYSLDGHASCGRLRPQKFNDPFPEWLTVGTQLKLSQQYGMPMDISITQLKLPRPGWKNDDHFAEFVVRQVTH